MRLIVTYPAAYFLNAQLEIPPSIPFDDLVTPFTSVPPVVLPDPQTILTEGPLTDAERVNKALEDYLSSLSSSWPLNLCRKVYRSVIPILDCPFDHVSLFFWWFYCLFSSSTKIILH
jgi:hypothetical protein